MGILWIWINYLGKKIKTERTDMKCFITGASGFLGTTLIQRLREINYECTAPTSYECNLLNYQNLMKFSTILILGKYLNSTIFH